jgi:hypothetical protein
MAAYGEWNRKGAVLSEVTAAKEYGVTREFIYEGIRAGKLEHRLGVVHGNPYYRILRSQLEQYLAEQLGEQNLATKKAVTELRKINKEITSLQQQLAELQLRKVELEGEGLKADCPSSRR